MAIARATSARIESSSSAIRTRDIGSHQILPIRTSNAASYTAAGNIALVEEADVDALALGGRRGEARSEQGVIAGLQHGLFEYRIPGIDFRSLRVADGKAQPRDLDRLAGLADNHAFDD